MSVLLDRVLDWAYALPSAIPHQQSSILQLFSPSHFELFNVVTPKWRPLRMRGDLPGHTSLVRLPAPLAAATEPYGSLVIKTRSANSSVA